MENKQLIVMRHAQTQDISEVANDFERELTPHGLVQAQYIATQLFELNSLPKIVVYSNARRVMQSCAALQAQWLDKCIYIIEPKMYNANLETWLSVAKHALEKYSSIMLVGHNPTSTQAVQYLSNKRIPYLKPAMVAILETQNPDFDSLFAGQFHLKQILHIDS